MSDVSEPSPMASWGAREGDALAPRAEFLAELGAAIARYAEATGTPEWLCASLAAAYCDDQTRELRGEG